MNCHESSWNVMNCLELSWIVTNCYESSWIFLNLQLGVFSKVVDVTKGGSVTNGATLFSLSSLLWNMCTPCLKCVGPSPIPHLGTPPIDPEHIHPVIATLPARGLQALHRSFTLECGPCNWTKSVSNFEQHPSSTQYWVFFFLSPRLDLNLTLSVFPVS